VQIRDLAAQRLEEQRHQHADFLFGPPPILAAECKQRQVFDTVPRGIFDDPAHGLHPRTDFTPERCPAWRGSERLRAQRPLPSMITATCRGMFDLAGDVGSDPDTQTSMSSLSFSASV
jgi:hypothetical protein